MNNWKRNLLASTLVFSLAIPVTAQAEGVHNPAHPTSGQVKQTIQHKWENHQLEHKKDRVRHALSLGVHRQMYLTLLAEKYTPKSVDEWKVALDRRERLVAEWKEEHEAHFPGSGDKDELRDALQQFKQIHEKFREAVESENADAIRAVLPKLLQEVQTVNKLMAAILEQKKN